VSQFGRVVANFRTLRVVANFRTLSETNYYIPPAGQILSRQIINISIQLVVPLFIVLKIIIIHSDKILSPF